MSYNQNKTNSAQNEQGNRFADAVKTNIDHAADRGHEAADAAREGLNTMADLREQAADGTKNVLQSGVEVASHQAKQASDRLTRALGFSGENSERLAQQSKQNMDVIARCGTVLTQAVQDNSRSWLELGQRQFQRNLEGLNRLMRAKSVQEFTATQGDLVREGVQHMVQDGRAIAERSLRAIDEAGKAFSTVPSQGSSQTR